MSNRNFQDCFGNYCDETSDDQISLSTCERIANSVHGSWIWKCRWRGIIKFWPKCIHRNNDDDCFIDTVVATCRPLGRLLTWRLVIEFVPSNGGIRPENSVPRTICDRVMKTAAGDRFLRLRSMMYLSAFWMRAVRSSINRAFPFCSRCPADRGVLPVVKENGNYSRNNRWNSTVAMRDSKSLAFQVAGFIVCSCSRGAGTERHCNAI